ncbi:Transcriptional activator FeaR [Ralstonia edaphis]|nr:Transcriptional activator FeaR [Ralstonia sp. LMG 6871]
MWQDAVCRAFLKLSVNTAYAAQFRGFIRSTQLSELRLNIVDAQGQHVERRALDTPLGDKECFYLNFQAAGSGVIQQHGETVHVCSGQWYVLDSTEPFSLIYGDNFRSVNFEIPMSVLGGDIDTARRAIGQAYNRGGTGIESYMFDQALTFARYVEDLSDARRGKAIGEFLDGFLEAINPGRTYVMPPGSTNAKRLAIDRFISDNITNPALSPSIIAAGCHVSVRSLHGLFENDGLTVMEFVKARRLELAKHSLQSGVFRDRAVSEIAFACGFADLSSFCRSYKKRFGVTPRSDRYGVLLMS